VIELLRRNRLIAALAVACAILLAAIGVEFATLSGGTPAPPPRKVAAAEAKLLPPIAQAAPEVLYPETGARPLWIPTRRPAPPPVVQQASFTRGQFILQGVITAGPTRIAMLKEKSTGRIHRVEQGREVNGLQVAEVENEKVTLAQGAEREVVELRVQKGAATPATPGAPAAPGMPGVPPAPGPQVSAGPFSPAASAPAAGGPNVPPPSAIPGLLPPGPMPSRPGTPSPTTPATANPAPGSVPQPQSSAPMTPEELLARRRARRNQSPE
jgi:hypothetical protein